MDPLTDELHVVDLEVVIRTEVETGRCTGRREVDIDTLE